MRQAWADETKRKHRSESAKKRWQNKEFRKVVTDAIKQTCGSSVICIETQQVYKNIRDVEEELQLNHSNICRAIRTGYRCGGYHWAYYEKNVS